MHDPFPFYSSFFLCHCHRLTDRPCANHFLFLWFFFSFNSWRFGRRKLGSLNICQAARRILEPRFPRRTRPNLPLGSWSGPSPILTLRSGQRRRLRDVCRSLHAKQARKPQFPIHITVQQPDSARIVTHAGVYRRSRDLETEY